MTRTPNQGATESAPATPAGALLSSYTPMVAHYAPGPFLEEQVVTPSDVKWMNARTYIVRNRVDRQEYRAIRVYDGKHFVGYWAVELLPPPLNFGGQFEGDREDSIEDYNRQKEQEKRDERRKRYRRHVG